MRNWIVCLIAGAAFVLITAQDTFATALPTYTAPADWTSDAISTLIWGASGASIVLVIGTKLFSGGIRAAVGKLHQAMFGRGKL